MAQVGSLFSSDAWNNITFTAGEVRDPQRNIPLSLAAGTGIVIVPLHPGQPGLPAHRCRWRRSSSAPDDRVATAALQTIFGGAGAAIMALAIMVSTFGCNNGLILAGARVYYAMARDGLFFRATGRLNARHVPAVGLVAARHLGLAAGPAPHPLRDAAGAPLLDPSGAAQYGNLYSNLLDYVVFSVLIFYILTIAGSSCCAASGPMPSARIAPSATRWSRLAYILAATVILVVLAALPRQTTWPGLLSC